MSNEQPFKIGIEGIEINGVRILGGNIFQMPPAENYPANTLCVLSGIGTMMSNQDINGTMTWVISEVSAPYAKNKVQKSANFTLNQSNMLQDSLIELTGTNAIEITIPPYENDVFQPYVGHEILLWCNGDGATGKFVLGAGVTVSTTPDFNTTNGFVGKFVEVRLKYLGSDNWMITGLNGGF